MKKILTILAIFSVLISCTALQLEKTESNSVPVNAVPAPGFENVPEMIVADESAIQEPVDGGSTQVVQIKGFAFIPQELTLNSGDAVLWKQEDSAHHTVTGNGWSSERLSKGDQYPKTFSNPGTYEYWCDLHPSMKGRIIVN